MKRAHEEEVTREWIYGLPDEIWQREIISHLRAPDWPRTLVQLRRTCKWFSTIIESGSFPTSSIIDEAYRLAQRREWWTVLAFRIEIPFVTGGDYMHYNRTIRNIIKQGQMPALWLVYGSTITPLPVLIDSSWFVSDDIKILKELWAHIARDELTIGQDILRSSLSTRNLKMYQWIVDILIDKKMAGIYAKVVSLWEETVIDMGVTGQKAWAKGYYNTFIKHPDWYPGNAGEQKQFWTIVTKWAMDTV